MENIDNASLMDDSGELIGLLRENRELSKENRQLRDEMKELSEKVSDLNSVVRRQSNGSAGEQSARIG